MSAASVYSFKVKTIEGEERGLANYQGKALLIVNVASKCMFTSQYKSLQTLYEKYREHGLEVLGFPANNFMGQEPASDAEIKEFCVLKYHVTFPMFSKISVKGENMDPLYRYLTHESAYPGEILWNFHKFLVDPSGQVVARYGSFTDPLSEKLTKELEITLPKK